MRSSTDLRGTTVAVSKTKIPRINHPLSTPGYVIIVQFILNCISNVVIFGLTYSLLAVVIPIALLFKFAKSCAIVIRAYTQGNGKTELGSTEEKYWFLKTASESSRCPNLVLLLVVKGELSVETVECLVRNRLRYSKDDEEKASLCRLATIPRYSFRELIWSECDLGYDKPVKDVRLSGRMSVFDRENRKFIVECSSANKNWQICVYSDDAEAMMAENNLILFQFDHCYADMNTLVQFLSRHFLDNPIFTFRGECSSSQNLCLGIMTLFAGPSVFFRTLFKTKDRIFSEPIPSGQKSAIFYSEAVSRIEIETISTATGSSANDVVLSCLAGSLRACLRQNGVVFPSDVNIYLPMNFQGSSSLRCFTSFNILSLPVGTEGALPRLWEVRRRCSTTWSLIQAITMNTVMQLAFLILPDGLARRLVQFLMEKSSCAVSCILGQTIDGEELLLDGRSIESFVPIEDTGYGISVSITQYEEKFQLAVLAPDAEDWVIKPSQLCAAFAFKLRELSARLTERARVIRARGKKLLNSRKNSVFIVEDEE